MKTANLFQKMVFGMALTIAVTGSVKAEPRTVDDIGLDMNVAEPVYFPSEVNYETKEGAEINIRDLDGDSIIDHVSINYHFFGHRNLRRNSSSLVHKEYNGEIEKKENDPWFL